MLILCYRLLAAQHGLVTPRFPALLHPLSKLAPLMGDFTIVPISVLTEQFLPPPEEQEHQSVAAWSKPLWLSLNQQLFCK